MPKFALLYPYFIIMVCMVIVVVGITNIVGMPVDLFPKIDIPVVVVATFYSGMPPEQIEADITDTFERFFTLASNYDHIESRSLTGVSLIKIYFNPGTDPNARFAIGLLLSIALVYLILMAQFTSFVDPFIILMAIPPGLSGVVLILYLTGSTLNIMSLMGVIMMTGIVVSNSILIVEFAGILHHQGESLIRAVVQACRIRLRPILMTSLATLLGMLPMALGLEAGSEQYAPLARAIIGGLGVSVIVTVFLVPAVYLLVHGKRGNATAIPSGV